MTGGFWDSYEFWQDAVIVSVIGGCVLAYLGTFVVLTRRAFVSSAISQLSSLGLVCGLMVLHTEHDNIVVIAGGLAFGVLGTALFALPESGRRLPGDAVLAAAVIGSSALTLVLSRYLNLEYRHVQQALYGDAVAATPLDRWVMVGAGTIVFGLFLLFHERFLFVTYDPETARVLGQPVRRLALLQGVSTGVMIALSTRLLGALTVFAFMVFPASAALLVAPDLRQAFRWALGFAAISAFGGYYLSFAADLPTGPSMAAIGLLALVISAAYRALRG